ncbi:choline/carnitine O-acyltransferase [Corynebacterium evansiae]|uniref:Choline/carnitine O-acyltransferase n=1 Tax=Corynebacterium evansiae TaxID=2913499 RepID=A0A9X3LNM9_9CORY|nr:choline/carnitine O-acyltransferase [Corynebacterium evansiae]MCZ9289948.1 choline/carnitine O-acyltransferase [Corynebacterium evansiae]
MQDNRAHLKPLPVPPLDATLPALRHAVSAVADADTLAATERTIEDFQANQGPALQSALEAFAADRDAANSSWLADRWLRDYLTVRTPLQTTSNVGFQINLRTETSGLDRAVDILRALALVHLKQADGSMPEEVDGRGNPLDANQWRCFNGALRIPRPDCDEVTFSELGTASRSIGMIVDGHVFDLRITDEQGRLASREQLRAILEVLRTNSDTAGSTTGDPAAPALDSRLSYLGSAALAEVPLPAETQATLRDQLFALHLIDDAQATDADLLRDLTFAPGHAWVYKPLTYEINLASNFAAMHVEHSTVDGATLVEAVRRVQEAVDSDAPTSPSADADVTPADVAPLELSPVAPAASIPTGDEYAVEIIEVPKLAKEELPFKFSADAMSQLILSIAQLLTFGRIRAVYEAVDMREYKAGRTECLRAVTPEAVAFAKQLVAGKPTVEALQEALNAHRNWVIGCKTGRGIDRHLWALSFTSEKQSGAPLALLADPGVKAARTDFLSTTSIGSDAHIIRYVFAPTIPNGFGVNYTPKATSIEYCLTFNRDKAEQPEQFQANLTRAAELLADFLRTL